MSLRASTLLVLTVLAAMPALAQDFDPGAPPRLDPEAPALTVDVIFQGLRDGFRVEGRRLLGGSQEIYLPSADVATVFRAGRYWQPATRRLNVRAREHAFVLTAGSRLVNQDGGELLLRTPPLAFAGDVWLPAEFLVRILGPAVGEVVAWDPEAPSLSVGSRSYNVTGVDLRSQTRATELRVRCTDRLGWRVDSPEQGLLLLKIYGGEVDGAAVGAGRPRGLVNSVQARQHADHAMLSVRISPLVSRFRTFSEDGGRVIVLVLEEGGGDALPEPAPRGHLNLALPGGLRDVSQPVHVRTVVIDPGHGGDDPGMVGVSGTLEKDVNLDIAKALRDALRRRDFQVVLTRDDDRLLGLDARAELANRAGGDLFLSLHANGWFNGRASGVETFFLDPAAPAREHDEAGDSGDFVPWHRVQEAHLGRSSDLAELVQEALGDRQGVRDRGVRRAGLRVLRGVDMPAVLVEMGFLSNATDERRLLDRDYQKELAEALAEAVERFHARYASLAAGTEEER